MTSGTAALASGVRDRALELKLSNNRLAAATGLSLPTVQKVVRGTGGKVARSTLHRLDRALGWDPGHAEDLLGADLVFDQPTRRCGGAPPAPRPAEAEQPRELVT